MGRPKKQDPEVIKSKSKSIVPDPIVKVDWARVKQLEESIKCGMPSISAMQASPQGVLRQHMDWEVRTRPLIEELSQLLGRRSINVERIRPGKDGTFVTGDRC